MELKVMNQKDESSSSSVDAKGCGESALRSPVHVEMINDVPAPHFVVPSEQEKGNAEGEKTIKQDEEDDEIDEEVEKEDFPIILVELLNDEDEEISGHDEDNHRQEEHGGRRGRGVVSISTTTTTESGSGRMESSSSYDGDESSASLMSNQETSHHLAVHQRIFQIFSNNDLLSSVWAPHATTAEDVSESHLDVDLLEKPWDNVERSIDESTVALSQHQSTTANEIIAAAGPVAEWCGMTMLWVPNPSAAMKLPDFLGSNGTQQDDDDDEDDDESIISNINEPETKRVFHHHHVLGENDTCFYISKEDVACVSERRSQIIDPQATSSNRNVPQNLHYDVPNVSSKTRFVPIGSKMTDEAITITHESPKYDDTQHLLRCCNQQLCIVPEDFKSFDEVGEDYVIKAGRTDAGLPETTVPGDARIEKRATAETTGDGAGIPKPKPRRESSREFSEKSQEKEDTKSASGQEEVPLTINTSSNVAPNPMESPSKCFGSVVHGAFGARASPRNIFGRNTLSLIHNDSETDQNNHANDSVNGMRQFRMVDNRVKDASSSDEESLDYNYTSETEEDELSEASEVLSFDGGFEGAQDSDAENVPEVKLEIQVSHVKGKAVQSSGTQKDSKARSSSIPEMLDTPLLAVEPDVILKAERFVLPNDGIQGTHPGLVDRDLMASPPCIRQRTQSTRTGEKVRGHPYGAEDEQLRKQSLSESYDGNCYDSEPEPCVSQLEEEEDFDDESLIDYNFIEQEIDHFWPRMSSPAVLCDSQPVADACRRPVLEPKQCCRRL